MKQKKKPNPKLYLCECGCKQPTIIYRGTPRRFIYTHYSKTIRKYKTRPPQKYCACGCNAATNFHRSKGYNTWLVGHFTRKKRELVFCACGCNTTMLSVSSYGRTRRYISGHHRKGKPSANRGIHFSEEWKHNMSLALIRSWKNRKKLL